MDIIVEYRKLGCPVTNCHNYLYDIQKWLREKYGLLIYISSKSQKFWGFYLCLPNESFNSKLVNEQYESFEKALEEGIIYCLKLVKNKDD